MKPHLRNSHKSHQSKSTSSASFSWFSQLQQLLKSLILFNLPADRAVSEFFRKHAHLGVRDRALFAETAFALLRRYEAYSLLSKTNQDRPPLFWLTALALADAAPESLLSVLNEQERDILQQMQAQMASAPPHIQCHLPQWLFDRLLNQYGEEVLFKLAKALNQTAPLDVRVNVLKTNSKEVLAALHDLKIVASPMPYAPYGIRLAEKIALQNLSQFKEGAIEVQDEGSQLLAHLTGAKRGETIADFCAGAGGKTLAIGAMMRNSGQIYAFDISAKRLLKLKDRVKRSGLSNVQPMGIETENDSKLRRFYQKMDRVLVDAPCSGIGTLRRNPDLKWRQNEQAIVELTQKQLSILQSAANLVKPGGHLIYATCSLLYEENQAIVEKFLSGNSDFVLQPTSELLQKALIPLEMGAYLQTLPHVHQMDGFFAVVLGRKKFV